MKGDDDAEILVKVSWFRPEEGDLASRPSARVARLQRRLEAHSRERIERDLGLIGETISRSDNPREPTQHAQFPTIRIGAPE